MGCFYLLGAVMNSWLIQNSGKPWTWFLVISGTLVAFSLVVIALAWIKLPPSDVPGEDDNG